MGGGDCLLFSEQRSGALVDMFFSTTRVFELDSKKMFQIITLKQKETTMQKRFKKKKTKTIWIIDVNMLS